jgi:hypothetical protein
MRLLLKINIKNGKGKNKLSEFQDKHDSIDISDLYKQQVINIFKDLGFHIYTKENYNNPEEFNILVNRVYEHVPDDVKDEELGKAMLVSFTSDGQIHFVVTAIHSDRLHLRAHSDTFLRIQRACKEINGRFPGTFRSIWYSILGRPFFKIVDSIQVMEHKQTIYTITGKVISSISKVAKQTIKENKINIYLFFIGLAIFLFVLYDKNWDTTQISSAPIFPAILLFIATNVVPLFTTFAKYFKNRPIIWSNFIID